MSTNFGVAPTRETQPAVAKKENVGVITSSPGPMPSAINATRIASVPELRPIACGTPRYCATSRSSPSTSGPPMNRWLSQTRAMAARISSRSGRYCAFRSRSGTVVKAASALHDFRRPPQRQGVAHVSGGGARPSTASVEDDEHLLAGIRGEIHGDGDPAPLGLVGERIDCLCEQLFEGSSVGHAGKEVNAVAFVLPRFRLHAKRQLEPAVIGDAYVETDAPIPRTGHRLLRLTVERRVYRERAAFLLRLIEHGQEIDTLGAALA